MARSRANSEGVARLCANRNSGRRYARYTLYFRVIGPSVYFRRQARANHRNAVCFYSASKGHAECHLVYFPNFFTPAARNFQKTAISFHHLGWVYSSVREIFYLALFVLLRWSFTRCRPLVYLLLLSTMNRPIRDENEVSPVTRLKLLRFLSYVYARYCQAPTRIPWI